MEELEFVKQRMKYYIDRKRIKGLTFKEGSKVWLLRKKPGTRDPQIKTTWPSDKLDHKKLGPFLVKRKVSEVNYELELPEGMKRYLIFHMALLELAHDDIPMEESIIVEPEEDIWDAEKILNSMNDDGKVKYLVKWKNFEHTENTWEPIEHLMGSQ